MTTPPPIAPAPEMPRQTSEEIPAAPAPKQEETPAEDQNTADPVDGEFKKVDEEIIRENTAGWKNRQDRSMSR